MNNKPKLCSLRTQFAPTVNFVFYSINITPQKLMLYKTNLLVSRNFARQGKASARPDGVVTHVEGDKSKL